VDKPVAKMNPAQLLNPKGFAKEQAKTNKRTPNYGTFLSVSLIVRSRHL